MKPAKFNLNKQLEELYEVKLNCVKGSPEYEEAKLTMLKLVGKFEMNEERYYKSNPYAHLAAIIKGRAIQRMIDVINKVGRDNVIQIIVDGLIYLNPLGKKIGDDKEYLGSLKQEFIRANGQFRLHNQYILEEDGVVAECHAGFDLNIESMDINKWAASSSVKFNAKLRELTQIEYLIKENK